MRVQQIAFLCVLVCFTSVCHAQPGLNIDSLSTIYNSWPHPFDIDMEGDYAYISSRSAGLRVIDISDPANPFEAGIYSHPYSDSIYTSGVRVQDSYAYLCANSHQLRILDVSDPDNITEVITYHSNAIFHRLDLQDDLLCLAAGDGGLICMNVANPHQPQVMGIFQTQGIVMDVRISGSYAYVATDSMLILDTSNPSHPVQVAAVECFEYARQVEILGNYAYMVSSCQLHIVDITDPVNPVLVSTTFIADYSEISVIENFVYARWGSQIYVYDSSDPTNLSIVESVYVPKPDCASLMGTTMVTAGSHVGMHVLDISTPDNPIILGSLNTGAIYSVDVEGDYACVATYSTGMSIVDISDLSHPFETGRSEAPQFSYDIHVHENNAFVVCANDMMYMMDVSDPEAPSVLGTYEFSTIGNQFTINYFEPYVYMTTENSGMFILDVSNPEAIFAVAIIETPFQASDVAVSGDYVYITDNGLGLYVYSIATPDHPSWISVVYIQGRHLELAVQDDYAYVTSSNEVLTIVDISDPHTPYIVSETANAGYTGSILVDGDYALIAGGRKIHVIDIQDPLSPWETGWYYTPGYASDLDFSDHTLVLADYNCLGIYDWSASAFVGNDPNLILPSTFEIQSIYPNPFNASATITVGLPFSADLRVSIHDILGREVGILSDSYRMAGVHQFHFDGAQLSSGAYFVKMNVPGESGQTRRMILLK